LKMVTPVPLALALPDIETPPPSMMRDDPAPKVTIALPDAVNPPPWMM